MISDVEFLHCKCEEVRYGQDNREYGGPLCLYAAATTVPGAEPPLSGGPAARLGAARDGRRARSRACLSGAEEAVLTVAGVGGRGVASGCVASGSSSNIW